MCLDIRSLFKRKRKEPKEKETTYTEKENHYRDEKDFWNRKPEDQMKCKVCSNSSKHTCLRKTKCWTEYGMCGKCAKEYKRIVIEV